MKSAECRKVVFQCNVISEIFLTQKGEVSNTWDITIMMSLAQNLYHFLSPGASVAGLHIRADDNIYSKHTDI